MRLRLVVALAVLTAARPAAAQDEAPAPAPGAVPALTGETFEARLGEILPKPDETAWREIPWRPTLWDAVVEAQAADRPILLWAMNGHPLACT